jgi:hypothetical protein
MLSSTGASSSSVGSAVMSRASSCVFEIGADRGAELADAVIAERQPQLERPGPAGQLEGFFEEREASTWSPDRGLAYSPVSAKAARGARVAVQQRPAIRRLVQPFVGVEGDRVSLRQAGEQLGSSHRRRRRRRHLATGGLGFACHRQDHEVRR